MEKTGIRPLETTVKVCEFTDWCSSLGLSHSNCPKVYDCQKRLQYLKQEESRRVYE